MSKRYNIKWRADDDVALKKAVKNFNAKITRLAKKNPAMASSLPEKTTVKELKGLISTRQDLNREINALRRFSKRGAEEFVEIPDNYYNLKITKWQKEEMTRRTATINRRRAKRYSELMEQEAYSRGEALGYKKADVGMGRADELSVRPVKPFTPKMTRHDLKKKDKMLRKESQDAYWNKRELQMKENYIKSLEENFNPSDIKDIVDRIRGMDYGEFKKIFDKAGLDFEFSYPPDQEAYINHLNALKTVWSDGKVTRADKIVMNASKRSADYAPRPKADKPLDFAKADFGINSATNQSLYGKHSKTPDLSRNVRKDTGKHHKKKGK